MSRMLQALLNLQSIETQLAQVRQRLRSRHNAVSLQEERIEHIREDTQALHDRTMQRRKDANRLGLDLKDKEQKVSKLRGSLNTAKTNKEYAAVLTQINSFKADNAKLEEEALRVMQHVDVLKQEAEQLQAHGESEAKRLAEVRQSSGEEIARLNTLMEKLVRQRAEAAKAIAPAALAAFERIVETYMGEAMAPVHVHGRKPPYQYVCGGCYMGLNAEHANALRVRDEIRTCDNCGRILYMEQPETQGKEEPAPR